jgi:hypothetical protein
MDKLVSDMMQKGLFVRDASWSNCYCVLFAIDLCGLDDWGLKSWQGLRIFLFTIVSRLALGLTHPPVQWAPGALLLGVKWPGFEADQSLPCSAKVKNV